MLPNVDEVLIVRKTDDVDDVAIAVDVQSEGESPADATQPTN